MSKTPSLIAILLLAASTSSFAEVEGMPGMPMQKFKKEYSVQNKEEGEKLLEDRGYGDKEPEVRMMNLMMVEGSGMEGMDMGAAPQHVGPITSADTAKQAAHNGIELIKAPGKPKVGANLYQFTILDPRTLKPAAKVNATAEVSMMTMDMGTESPKVKEIKPGVYEVKAPFSMAGSWSLKIKTPQGERTFEVEVSK